MPSQKCRFLGFIINTEKYAVELSEQKQDNLLLLIEQFLNKSYCTIQEFAQLIGKLISCPAVEYSWFYTKILEKEKLFYLIINGYDYNRKI